MNMKDLGLVPSVAQCVKDAEGTAEIIKEQIPRLRSRAKKRQSERSLEFFRGGGLPLETIATVGIDEITG